MPEPEQAADKAHAYTRAIEFDFVSWTVDALLEKQQQAALGITRYLNDQQQHDAVKKYLALVTSIEKVESKIQLVFADPQVTEKEKSIAPLSAELARLKDIRRQLGPVAEEILQSQVSSVLADFGLAVAGQTLPPLLYSVTPLPYALIISPRDVISQINDISLAPDLTLDQMVALEKQVEKNLNVSALVEPVGGIGIYPTMVISTTDLPLLAQVVSHEWTHNFLTLHPLGINYFTTSQLRTINETTANLVGDEIGAAVIARYYPEYAPKPQPAPLPTPTGDPAQPTPTPAPPSGPPPFNFNKEMHITRVNVDQMLKDKKIEQAEAYMETRRQFFWDNGYLIRRLNQAYFAFHGAYADNAGGGGAFGTDPVGPAVVKFRQQSKSLADFLNRISWITSFDELTRLLNP